VHLLSEEFSNPKSWRPTKISTVHTVNDGVVRHSLAYVSVQKWFAWDVPYYVKIWPKQTYPVQKHRFPMYIFCSASHP